MRSDGTRVKGLTPVMQALPHIMPKRFDAQNWASDYVDEDIVKTFIRQKRREGHRVTHMSVLVAAYYKAALENPQGKLLCREPQNLQAESLLLQLCHPQDPGGRNPG